MLERRLSAVLGSRNPASDGRRRAAAGLGSLAVAVAVALAGCGGTSGSAGSGVGSSTGSTPAPTSASASAVIARAADVSGAAKGLKLRMNIIETIPGASTVTIDATGAFSNVNHSGTMTTTIHTANKSVQTREVSFGPKVYVELPPSAAAKLPGGKRWVEIDYSKVSKQSYLSNVASLTTSQYQSPTQALEYLKAESSNVENLGPATVNGIATTHYHAMMNLNKAGTGLPAKTHAALQGLLRKLPGTILDKTQIPLDVWIDGDHLVRRLSISMQMIPDGTSETVEDTTTFDITAYGPQPKPTPPPASQTLNLLALLQAEGKTAALSGG